MPVRIQPGCAQPPHRPLAGILLPSGASSPFQFHYPDKNVDVDASTNEGVAFAIFDYLGDPVVITDARFEPPGPKVIYVNDAFTAAFAFSKDTVVGQPFSMLYPELRQEHGLSDLAAACEKGRTCNSKALLDSNGEASVLVDWRIAPVSGDEHLHYLICTVKPVADSPAFINALRASEKRYRNLFEQGLVSKAILTVDGRFSEVNQSFCDLTGYSRDELIGVHSSLVIKPDEHEEVFERVHRIASGGQPGYQTEREYIHKQGHVVTVLVNVMPDETDDGVVGALVIQAQDISGLKAIEAGLRESESQLKAIFDHSPTEVYLKDAQGRYVKINRQFERMFNVRDEDLKGKLPHDAHYKDLADRTRAHDLQVLRTGKVVVREEEAFLKNLPDKTPHVLHTTKFPIFDDDRVVGLGAIVTDITDMKRAEQALRESESRLRDFAEIAADWFWETDENLFITYISDVHRVTTGIPDDHIIGRTREDLFREKIYQADNPAVHLQTLNSRWESMVEYSVTRSDGHQVVIHDRATPFFDALGNFKGYRGVGRDITEQKRLNERIAHQATRDPLTGAFNRREFERHLDEAVRDSRIQGNRHVLCFTDLNKFKLLNDTLGHAAGDETLKSVVAQIQEHIGTGDLLGRIGGDEFGILMRNAGTGDAERIASRIAGRIGEHAFRWQDRVFNIAISIGLAPIDGNTKSSSELMARADSACYRAKSAGEHGVWISDDHEAARLRTYSEILGSLTEGPADLSDNVQLVGQPICSLSNPGASPAWYEVLLRLVGDDGGFYRPHEFIRLAEQHGKMPLIDHWVLEQSIAAHARLVARVPDAILSINIADNSLTSERLRDLTGGILKDSPVKPANLCFEIGEATAMIDLPQTVALAESLSEQGFRIALDEFGSGPSSFECLKNLPVHYLKLYGNLVRELREPGPDLAIIESMRDLSRRLDLTMVAVQVETDDAASALTRIGVEYGQGDALATIRPLNELISELAG